MFPNMIKSTRFDTLRSTIRNANMARLMVGRELYEVHQIAQRQSGRTSSMSACMKEVAAENQHYDLREYQRLYRVYERLVVEAGLDPETLADFAPGLLVLAAENRCLNPGFRRTVFTKLHTLLSAGMSFQELRYFFR